MPHRTELVCGDQFRLRAEGASVQKVEEYRKIAADLRAAAEKTQGLYKEQLLELAAQWEALSRERLDVLETRLRRPARSN